MSNQNPLHLIERDFITRPIVELRRPRRFMRRDHGSVFKRSAVLQICRDAGGSESMAARRRGETGRQSSALNHTEHISAGDRVRRYLAVLVRTPEEGRL